MRRMKNIRLTRLLWPLCAVATFLAGSCALGPRLAAAQTSVTTPGFQWQSLGQSTFRANCAGCHQESGQGVSGAFPPLAGHAPELAAQKSGRNYLVRVVLFGLEGSIVVDGNSFNAAMPPWAQLSDDQIAAVLDYVLNAWGNDQKLPAGFAPILPADVAAARSKSLTSSEVYALRREVLPSVQTTNASPAGRTDAKSVPTFTAEQAERGEAAYRHACQDCHGSALDNGEFGGPPIKGPYFSAHWGTGNVAALYAYTKTKMPPDRPGDLSAETYIDLIAFILSRNGYQDGAAELSADLDALQRMSLKK